MASSISSERAFSAAGITISKRCNRLQGDIVEAIEVNKSLKHCDLIFRKVLSMEQVERDLEDVVSLMKWLENLPMQYRSVTNSVGMMTWTLQLR
jgi:hypothetical protein